MLDGAATTMHRRYGIMQWRRKRRPTSGKEFHHCHAPSVVSCSHVTAEEPVNCLTKNKRTKLTALRSRALGSHVFYALF